MQQPSRITPFGRLSDVEAASMLSMAIRLLRDSASDDNEIAAARLALRRLYLDGFTSNFAVLTLVGLNAKQIQMELDSMGENLN